MIPDRRLADEERGRIEKRHTVDEEEEAAVARQNGGKEGEDGG
jgi:hypothetical protein